MAGDTACGREGGGTRLDSPFAWRVVLPQKIKSSVWGRRFEDTLRSGRDGLGSRFGMVWDRLGEGEWFLFSR